MANFKDFFGEKSEPKPEPEHIRVYGSFMCQTCNETCAYANKTSDNHLVWTCSQGHISKIVWTA